MRAPKCFVTQIHYAHHLPCTNPIPNATPDQSWLNTNRTDHTFAVNKSSRGLQKRSKHLLFQTVSQLFVCYIGY